MPVSPAHYTKYTQQNDLTIYNKNKNNNYNTN